MGLITKEVKVELNNRNIKYYESLGYEIPRYKDASRRISVKRGTKIVVKTKDLPNGSNAYVDVKCDNCDEILKNIRWNDYTKQVKPDNKYYCNKCANKLYGGGIQKRLSNEEI